MESIVPLAATLVSSNPTWLPATTMFVLQNLESIEVDGVRIVNTSNSNILLVNNTKGVSITNCEIYNTNAVEPPQRSILLQNTGNDTNFTKFKTNFLSKFQLISTLQTAVINMSFCSFDLKQ